jgi:hypothetical protein
VVIFSRRRGGERRDQDRQPSAAGGDAGSKDSSVNGERDDRASLEQNGRVVDPEKAEGPYDSSEVSEDSQAIDLGALRIPMVEGVELRVQADPEGRVQHVILVAGPSALQLAAFAAPKTEPIWDEARDMLRAQLRSDGFTSREVDGEYGTELRARVRTPDGMADIRFVGLDGPRWLVRGVFQGAAATDPQAEGPLRECLLRLVVHRGHEAMPVHDALPLRLPREATDQGDGTAAAPAEDASDAKNTTKDTTARAVNRPSGRQRPRRR